MTRTPKQPTSRIHAHFSQPVKRRQALKGMGALAVSGPALAACSSDPEDTPGGGAGGTDGLGPSTNPTNTGTQPTSTGPATATSPSNTSVPTATPGPTSPTAPSTTATPIDTNPTGQPSQPNPTTSEPSPAAGGAPSDGTGGAGGSGEQANGGQPGAGGEAGENTGGTQGQGGQDPGPSNGDLTPPSFDQVNSCTLTPTDSAGEGPFFIHEEEVMNDVALFRTDIRDGKPGVELELHFRLLDTAGGCNTPIPGVEVYIWHTDALGLYSGFDEQNPDQSYTGAFEREVENSDRFCRGAGVTNADGVVSFRTVYPGWYNGRPVHVHLVVLRPGSGPGTQSYRSQQYHAFTTQFYFEEALSREVHENNEPYTQRASGQAYETYVRPATAVRPTVTKRGDVLVGALNVLTNPAESRGGSSGGGFGGFGG